MNIHDHIKQLLSEGEIVYSFALGRVGQIIAIENDSILPVHVARYRPGQRGRLGHIGVTTFLSGDKVALATREDAGGKKVWAVVNI